MVGQENGVFITYPPVKAAWNNRHIYPVTRNRDCCFPAFCPHVNYSVYFGGDVIQPLSHIRVLMCLQILLCLVSRCYQFLFPSPHFRVYVFPLFLAYGLLELKNNQRQDSRSSDQVVFSHPLLSCVPGHSSSAAE